MRALDRILRRAEHSALDLPGITSAPFAITEGRLARAPGRLWVVEMAEAAVQEGPLNMAVVLDAHSRRCLGSASGDRPDPALVRTALRMALSRRWPEVPMAQQHRASAGSVAVAVGDGCGRAGIERPRGTTAHPRDRALARGFFDALNSDLAPGDAWKLRSELSAAASRWIEDDYNPRASAVRADNLSDGLRGPAL